MAYLLLLLESVPAVPEGGRCGLEKYADALSSALKRSLTDALPGVRALARTSFWAFDRHFPSRAKRILQVLDQSTAKLVQVACCLQSLERAAAPASFTYLYLYNTSRTPTNTSASALPRRREHTTLNYSGPDAPTWTHRFTGFVSRLSAPCMGEWFARQAPRLSFAGRKKHTCYGREETEECWGCLSKKRVLWGAVCARDMWKMSRGCACRLRCPCRG
jgi:hypothetical protein